MNKKDRNDREPLPLFQWETPNPANTSRIDEIAAKFDLPKPIANILLQRPFLQNAQVEDIKNFLEPSLKNLTPPEGLPGIPEATQIIWNAIHEKKKIFVFGDFDADGICATSILVRILLELDADATPFIPERLMEGYGLTKPAIDRCFKGNGEPDLLITVDCGINSIQEVAYIKSKGIQVIVTDHHTPGDELPAAACVINPMLPHTHKALQNLCGAGVAFKLVQSLIQTGKKAGWYTGEKVIQQILAEAAIATIADVVPLTGENRILVHEALAYWRELTPLGIQALLREISTRPIDQLCEDQISFSIAPYINASGRMGSPETAYKLLSATTPDQAKELAVHLKELNTRRKQTEAAVLGAALKQIDFANSGDQQEQEESLPEAIVVAGPEKEDGDWSWHPGVIGIVSSRLADRFGRPSAVLSLDGDDPAHAAGHGSIRAACGYNVKEALDHCASTLSSYGGHSGAAGFSVLPGCLDQFQKLLCEACKEQRKNITTTAATLQIDQWLTPKEITADLYEQSRKLGPFGSDNPKIHWGVQGVEIQRVSILGANSIQYHRPTHLSLSFSKDGVPLPQAIWFRQGNKEAYLRQLLEKHQKVDIVFELARNDFTPSNSVEMVISDIRPSAESVGK